MPRKNDLPPGPPPSRMYALKDGFWEETNVYQYTDGTQVVRKANKPASQPGPWAIPSLRKEIRYLQNAPSWFPPLLRSWDYRDDQGLHVGFEIPFYQDHQSAAQRVISGKSSQSEADTFQDNLAACLLHDLHTPQLNYAPLSNHFLETLTSTCNQLGKLSIFRPIIHESHVIINGNPYPGLRALMEQALEVQLFARADQGPQVRLHGDLILENILIPKTYSANELILIDPVSVAGIDTGPALMDLVKYESYASGHLLAIRSEWLNAGPLKDGYRVLIDHEHDQLRAFRQINWRRRFREAYLTHHGPIDQPLYHLLDAYYALVMAVNTTGVQQWARVLLGLQSLHRALHAPAT